MGPRGSRRLRSVRTPRLALVILLVSGCAHQVRTFGPESPVTSSEAQFTADVWPLLERHCHACHGAFYQLGGLSLDTEAGIRRGSKNGPVIEPGKPEASELFRRISLPEADEDRMPQKAKRLATEEIETIRSWIAAGASFESE